MFLLYVLSRDVARGGLVEDNEQLVIITISPTFTERNHVQGVAFRPHPNSMCSILYTLVTLNAEVERKRMSTYFHVTGKDMTKFFFTMYTTGQ